MQTLTIEFKNTREYIRWRRNINTYARFESFREIGLTEKDGKLIATILKLN